QPSRLRAQPERPARVVRGQQTKRPLLVAIELAPVAITRALDPLLVKIAKQRAPAGNAVRRLLGAKAQSLHGELIVARITIDYERGVGGAQKAAVLARCRVRTVGH